MNASNSPATDAAELPDANAIAPLDEHGCIVGDVICQQCGYNLRGLQPGGDCPECGMAVERSYHHNLLVFADRRWLARSADGAFVLAMAVVVCHVNLCALVVPSVVTLVLRGLTLIALGVGVWLLTRPEPLAPGQKPAGWLSVRRGARAMCVLAPGAMIGAMAWQTTVMGEGAFGHAGGVQWFQPDHVVGFVLLQVGPVLLMSALIVLTAAYAGALARRIPSGRLMVALLAMGLLIAVAYAMAWLGIAAQYYSPDVHVLSSVITIGQWVFEVNAMAISWLVLPAAVLLPFLMFGAIVALLRLSRALRLLSLGERVVEDED